MIYCENVVKILWTWHFLFFFYSSLDFGTTFFSPIFGNAIATIVINFFSPYFGNGIATISLSQFFFSHISTMALPQLVCHNFFSPILAMTLPQTNCKNFFSSYFSKAIATNPFHFFFLYRNDTCTHFLQQILSARLLLLD